MNRHHADEELENIPDICMRCFSFITIHHMQNTNVFIKNSWYHWHLILLMVYDFLFLLSWWWSFLSWILLQCCVWARSAGCLALQASDWLGLAEILLAKDDFIKELFAASPGSTCSKQQILIKHVQKCRMWSAKMFSTHFSFLIVPFHHNQDSKFSKLWMYVYVCICNVNVSII